MVQESIKIDATIVLPEDGGIKISVLTEVVYSGVTHRIHYHALVKPNGKDAWSLIALVSSGRIEGETSDYKCEYNALSELPREVADTIYKKVTTHKW